MKSVSLPLIIKPLLLTLLVRVRPTSTSLTCKCLGFVYNIVSDGLVCYVLTYLSVWCFLIMMERERSEKKFHIQKWTNFSSFSLRSEKKKCGSVLIWRPYLVLDSHAHFLSSFSRRGNAGLRVGTIASF